MNKTKKNQNNKRITKKNQIKQHIRNTKKNKKHSLKHKMKGGSFSWPFDKKSNTEEPNKYDPIGSNKQKSNSSGNPGMIMSTARNNNGNPLGEEVGPVNNRARTGIRYRKGPTRSEILEEQKDQRKAQIAQQDLKRREAGRKAREEEARRAAAAAGGGEAGGRAEQTTTVAGGGGGAEEEGVAERGGGGQQRKQAEEEAAAAAGGGGGITNIATNNNNTRRKKRKSNSKTRRWGVGQGLRSALFGRTEKTPPPTSFSPNAHSKANNPNDLGIELEEITPKSKRGVGKSAGESVLPEGLGAGGEQISNNEAEKLLLTNNKNIHNLPENPISTSLSTPFLKTKKQNSTSSSNPLAGAAGGGGGGGGAAEQRTTAAGAAGGGGRRREGVAEAVAGAKEGKQGQKSLGNRAKGFRDWMTRTLSSATASGGGGEEEDPTEQAGVVTEERKLRLPNRNPKIQQPTFRILETINDLPEVQRITTSFGDGYAIIDNSAIGGGGGGGDGGLSDEEALMELEREMERQERKQRQQSSLVRSGTAGGKLGRTYSL